MDNTSKSFQKIEDLLKLENPMSNEVHSGEIEKEKQKLEDRKNQIKLFKDELTKLKDLPQNGYMDTISKMLVEKGLVMLDALQKEIEDSPRGRDVETAAAMMSSINSIIDNLNKQKIYSEKMDLERQKLELKKSSINLNNGNTYTQTNNIAVIGSHTELLDMIRGNKPFPGEEPKSIIPEKILSTKDHDKEDENV
jgi:hypothetical protein